MIITTQWDEILTEVAFFQGGGSYENLVGTICFKDNFSLVAIFILKKISLKKARKGSKSKKKMIGTCPVDNI